jgi:CBS domain-containing protein
VVENSTTRTPVGVVTDRDIVVRVIARGMNPIGMTARQIMSTPAFTVMPDTPLEDCCRTLEVKQVRRAPVVDEQGSCCGMISQADIAQHASERITAEVVRTVSQPDHV